MTTLKRNSIGHTLGNAQIKREDPLCAFPSVSPDVLMRFVKKKNPPVNIRTVGNKETCLIFCCLCLHIYQAFSVHFLNVSWIS